MSDASALVYASAASAWEIAIKAALGKLAADARVLARGIHDAGFTELGDFIAFAKEPYPHLKSGVAQLAQTVQDDLLPRFWLGATRSITQNGHLNSTSGMCDSALSFGTTFPFTSKNFPRSGAEFPAAPHPDGKAASARRRLS